MKNLTKLKNKIICLILLLFLMAPFAFFNNGIIARAEYDFDTSGALEDLSQIEGFDVNDYPVDYYGLVRPAEIITMMEFGYSPKFNEANDYAIYVYFYNPQLLKINVNSPLDTIQIATEYDTSPVTRASVPTNYEKFGLTYCDSYTSEEYAGRFLKFRVVDTMDSNGKTLFERVNPELRRYDISGVTLYTEDGTAKEYEFEVKYFWSGYAAGYNGNLQSTLKNDFEEIETIELDVKQTFWRSETSSKGENWQNQVNSVYFSIPNHYLTKYGKLQRIKADWYEYQTKDIIVTSNEDCYNALIDYVGQDVSNVDLNIGLADQVWDNITSVPSSAYWTYGAANGKVASLEETNELFFLLPTSNWGSVSAYDPYASLTTSGGITSNKLYDYIRSYDKTFNTGTVPSRYGNLSADLFESDIPTARKVDNAFGKIQKGYSYYDFDIDTDLFEIQNYNHTIQSFYTNTKVYGFWNTLFNNFSVENSYKDVPPIMELNEKNFDVDNPEAELLIRSQDLESVKEYINDATSRNESTFIFRFAVSDYYSSPVSIYMKESIIPNINWTENEAYRAKQSIFLDFDIIQLTFNDEGSMTVIPVVSDPFDIVSDVTTPTKMSNTWMRDFLNNVGSAIGSWGVLIVLIIVLVIALFIAIKLIELFKTIPWKFVAILFILLTLAGLIAGYYFAISFGIDLIEGLGGLF